jgi:hypothetical protein
MLGAADIHEYDDGPYIVPEEPGGADPYAALESWHQFDKEFPRPPKNAPLEDHAEHFVKTINFALAKGFFQRAPQGWVQRKWPRLWFLWRETFTDKPMGLHEDSLLANTDVGRAWLAELRKQGRLI